MYYILIGQTPVPATLLEWVAWFKTADRRVMLTHVLGVQVSTVFLGLDHNFLDGPPVLFESMAFWEDECGEMARCCTWSEAEKMHQRMCRDVASPRALLNYVRRTATAWCFDARHDLQRLWREQMRGCTHHRMDLRRG